jgi:hypothetical protein
MVPKKKQAFFSKFTTLLEGGTSSFGHLSSYYNKEK